MQKSTLSLKNGVNMVNLENYITTTSRSRMVIQNAYVYWYFKNVVSGVNNKIMAKGGHKYLSEGYWSFDAITLFLKAYDIELRRTTDGKCEIKTKQIMNVGSLGPLLGFEKYHTDINPADGWVKSPKHVDVNRGVRYIIISCTDVNSVQNYDVEGKRSFYTSVIPIPSDQSLFSSVTNFIGVNSEAPMSNGTFNKLEFGVTTNVGNIVDMEVVLEAHIT